MSAALLHHPFMSRRARKESSGAALVEAMLAFELALAEAQEAAGLLPPGTAARMQATLRLDDFDLAALGDGVVQGGNVAIPFVKQGRALLPEELKAYWHRGATSQDVLDSALMLLLKSRLHRVDELLARIRRAGIRLMEAHELTPMVGRTLMQQALPMTFGVKVAQWAVGLEQARRRLESVTQKALVVQFGGAVGVHSGLDEHGMDLMRRIADRLGLAAPVLPWHSNRQLVHAMVTALDAVAVGADKVALDVALLTQTEVAEVSEPVDTGMGESSSMPHKRNPVRCALIRAACRQIHGHTSVVLGASVQPLERGLGEWHAEWWPLLETSLLLEGALEQLSDLLEGLEVHPESMRRNLAITAGAIMAEPIARLITPHVGAETAKQIAADAAQVARAEERPIVEVLAQDPRLEGRVDRMRLEQAAAPEAYLGTSQQQVRAALEWLLET